MKNVYGFCEWRLCSVCANRASGESESEKSEKIAQIVSPAEYAQMVALVTE